MLSKQILDSVALKDAIERLEVAGNVTFEHFRSYSERTNDNPVLRNQMSVAARNTKEKFDNLVKLLGARLKQQTRLELIKISDELEQAYIVLDNYSKEEPLSDELFHNLRESLAKRLLTQLQDMGCLCEELLSALGGDVAAQSSDGLVGIDEIFKNLKSWCMAHKEQIAKTMMIIGSALKLQSNVYCRVGGELLSSASTYLKSTGSPIPMLSSPDEPKSLTFERDDQKDNDKFKEIEIHWNGYGSGGYQYQHDVATNEYEEKKLLELAKTLSMQEQNRETLPTRVSESTSQPLLSIKSQQLLVENLKHSDQPRRSSSVSLDESQNSERVPHSEDSQRSSLGCNRTAHNKPPSDCQQTYQYSSPCERDGSPKGDGEESSFVRDDILTASAAVSNCESSTHLERVHACQICGNVASGARYEPLCNGHQSLDESCCSCNECFQKSFPGMDSVHLLVRGGRQLTDTERSKCSFLLENGGVKCDMDFKLSF